jgi:hypothetical protein
MDLHDVSGKSSLVLPSGTFHLEAAFVLKTGQIFTEFRRICFRSAIRKASIRISHGLVIELL